MEQVSQDAENITKQVQLIQANKLNPDVQTSAMYVIQNVLRNCELEGRSERIVAFQDAGGLPLLLSALGSSRATSSLQLRACDLLGFIALFNGGNKEVIEKVPEAIMAWMETYPDLEDIQKRGVTVLTYFVWQADDGVRQVLLDKGVFKFIFAYIAKYPEDVCPEFDDSILSILKKLVHCEQVLQIMSDDALDTLLACLARNPRHTIGIAELLREVAEASSKNRKLRARLQEAGVFYKLVQCLKAGFQAEGEKSDDDTFLHDGLIATCFAVFELAESCEDVLRDTELAEKLNSSSWYLFNISVLSGRSTATIVLDKGYVHESSLMRAVGRKLHIISPQATGATFLLGNDPLPSGCVRDWGLDTGKIYNLHLVFTKRRRLTDIDDE
eukprot:CAMPEP_0178411286 /NCGR_PEP_ID=MMETSP0689_2-20121128/21416_1 /TAXON_ID=160604 /ORGANISM="Amphidinium massartii, Strain CS-259" /LENGTH=384 /DNA_ID=CAMNT_0020032487 /DNA_START=19 /DNA_END=1173 /DNA_ORIENTATION=+